MRLIALALLLIIMCLGGGLFYSVDKQIGKKKLSVVRTNETLPDFKVISLDGREVDFNTEIGHGSRVIIFVNPGCSHCEAQLSALNNLDNEIPVTVVADLKEDSESEMKRIATSYGAHVKLYFDLFGERQQRLGIETVPYTVIVDQNRVVRITFEGERDAAYLADSLNRLSGRPAEEVKQ